MEPSNDDISLRVAHLEGRADHFDARMDRISEILNQAAEIGLKNSMEIAAFREALREQARDNQAQHEAFFRETEAWRRGSDERLEEARLESGREYETARRDFAEGMREIKQTMKELAESQRHGDEKLNALIPVVDDLIRKRRPLQ